MSFSFYMEHLNLNNANIKLMAKETPFEDYKDKNINEIFKNSFQKYNLQNINIKSILNDSMATLITGMYKYNNCNISVILGTGHNICIYYNNNLINLESGGFKYFPSTTIDILIDYNSKLPNFQLAEKKVGGLYLSKIVTHLIHDYFSDDM